jgi:hypothetical protein
MRAFLVLFLLACEAPRAGVEIEEVTASRDAARKVVVDVVIRAREGLGGNIGNYCAQATFPGQSEPVEICASDLEDGDTKALHFVSANDVAEGSIIAIRVRHEHRDRGANVVAPR